MSLLPAILRPSDTSTKLKAARDRLGEIEARRQRCESEYTAAIASDDYEARAKSLRREAAELDDAADDCRRRIARLEKQLAVEQAVYQSNRFESAKERAAQRVALRKQARDRAVASWRQAVSDARDYARVNAAVMADWPKDLPVPYVGFDTRTELGKLITAVALPYAPDEMFSRITRKAITASECVDRLLGADERIRIWAAVCEDDEAERLAALSSATLPEPEPRPEPEEYESEPVATENEEAA